MNIDWSSFWLGVAALPLTAATLAAAWFLAVGLLVALERRGLTVEVRLTRNVEAMSDYMLRRDIWWERSFGPVFVGGWYRQEPRYQEPEPIFITRWIGFGKTTGPSIAFFRKRSLGFAPYEPPDPMPPLTPVGAPAPKDDQ